MHKEEGRTLDLLSYIKEEKGALTFGGFYPSRRQRNRTSTYFASVFFMNFALLYNFLGITNALKNIFDVSIFSTLILHLLKGLSYSCKIGNLLIFRKNVLLIDDMLQNPKFTKLDTPTEENILKDNLEPSRMLKIFYRGYIITSVFIQALYPVVSKSETKHNSNLWFPFNPEDNYLPVYCFEVLSLLVSSCFRASVDLLTVILINLSATQFIIVEYRLRHVQLIPKDEEITRDVLEQLHRYIDHHNYSYRLSTLIENTFSFGIFAQMACSVLVIIIGVLKAVTIPVKSIQFLIMVANCLCMIIELAPYCYYGQKILSASSKIAEACYMSEWYQCDAKIQEYFVMIMSRGNRIVILKAVKLFSLTLATLLSICSSAYSLFAILIHIQRGDN